MKLEEHELIEYAQSRIKQKKRLYRHFVFFIIGCIFLWIINKSMDVGGPSEWWLWVVLFWLFLFSYHTFNVFVTHRFMNRKWERKQREQLIAKQRQRIQELQKEIEVHFPMSVINKKKE
ncbi:2TM domain-containing protein [Arenibacter sp. GZD96]|uniref:2TM domain-containing protein n=1 Tax=Aurantibrevibacter litoralis TaxID=3106030 RepID=UPI002AFF1296|nr:2TM domain-containing protein [Arenibacter sp. GZD-96]MEA1784638.1 2TM domain-containing protein [Arenibacter sp. GZD-96]